MVVLISRCILADLKQNPDRRPDHQPGAKRLGKTNQKQSLDVSGVVYEKVTPPGPDSMQKNEGEGNRTAAREYNDAAHRFVQSGRVQESSERAKSAVEGSEKAELDRAEKVGKSKIREEDPAVERKPHR
jgi:hypothetical protein